ncbi:MAG: sugar phosphate isomerase/epimerase family protein [Candidatus Hodarchaeaceae archaeon]|nr:sugar phosphate isomerase/epimerase family protein [Candidatus Hodarchaeaceae archaeon]
MVRLGRDYTNCFVFDNLGASDKRAFEKGELDLGSINAVSLEKTKRNVEQQIKVTRELGMTHLELDADSPNPYLDFDGDRRREVKEDAESYGVTLSLHLPYSYIGACVCAPQGRDRRVAVELHRRCIQFAADVGAKYLVMHPGSVPFYHRSGKYMEYIHDSLFKSLLELGKFASELGLALHLENNTAFDGIYSEIEDCLSMVREVREKGVDIYFNFDIGHWLTRADLGAQLPDPPESALELLPPDYLKELHLNDYVPGERMFHPPIHLGWGLLQRGNLERYARLVKRKGVEVVVLETALKNVEQVLDRREILEQETKYVRDIFES